MKKLYVGIAVAVALVIVGALFFTHTYTSSPGLTTPDMAQEFSAPTCFGVSILLNAEEAAADAPGQSLCIGILQ